MELFKLPPNPGIIEGRSDIEHAKVHFYFLIQIIYLHGLEDFLENHIRAREIDYIELIDDRQKRRLTKLKKLIGPGFWAEETYEFTTEDYERKLLVDEYWFYTGYQRLLLERRREFAHWSAAKEIPENVPQSTIKKAVGLLESVLLNLTSADLTSLLLKLGLVNATGKATSAATPGAWVGAIHGLLDATPPRLRNNKAAIRRAFCEQFGAVVGERAVQAGPGKRGSEAEQFRDNTLALLRKYSSAE